MLSNALITQNQNKQSTGNLTAEQKVGNLIYNVKHIINGC